MSPPTCHDVESQIELFALGECAELERSAIARHLGTCPACTGAFKEARQLLGLLDLIHQEEDRLRRLRMRIEAEGGRKVRKATVLPFARRAAGLAAMLVLAVGLSGWMERPDASPGPAHGGGGGLVAVVVGAGGRDVPAIRVEPGGEIFHLKRVDFAVTLDLGGQTPDEARDQLRAKARKGQLPPAQRVDLSFVLRNTGNRPIQVWTGGEATGMLLQLRGPGWIDVTAPVSPTERGRATKTVRLEPGESCVVPIIELAYRDRGVVHHLYWTEPGEYTLTVQFRTGVRPPPPGAPPLKEGFGLVTLSSAPITIRVEAKE